MIAVVDYGMGNLRSMAKAIEHVGDDVLVTSSADDLREAERIVLPGVGAFGEAVANLHSTGLVDVLRAEVIDGGKPFLGVCLGMQLLADKSLEHGHFEGLGWIPGRVVPMNTGDDPRLHVPHTGWNDIEVVDAPDSPLRHMRPKDSFYFNHSFVFEPANESDVAARAFHGNPFVAAVRRGNVLATQFHPEKSQKAGLDLLVEFTLWKPEPVAA